MFRSLRGRLLLTYTMLILVVLFVILVAALLIGSLPRVRYLPTVQRLDAISQISRSEILRLAQTGASQERILSVLRNTAEENNVRVLVITLDGRRVVFDSQQNSWVNEVMRDILIFDTEDPNTLAGLYTHENGSRWLIYSRAIDNRGFTGVSALLVYAAPEPTRLALFRELGLGLLLFWSGGATFVLAALLAFAVSTWVARPLQQMAGAAEAIAQGDYEQSLSLIGPEEVQRVAHSFNTMSQQVATTRQAQRDFVANVSHDLKTPLTSIQGWSQALLDGTAVSPATQTQAATVIHTEAARMSRMVGQLLDLARIESGQLVLHKAPVDLLQLLADLRQSFAPRAEEKGVHLQLNQTAVPPIEGDPDRLVQIFSNLIDNAITHTPPGGTVEVATRLTTPQTVEICIQDSGKGIPQKELARIFERFYQVDKSRAQAPNQRHGSGLGLSIVCE